jgi:acetyl esterase
MSPSLKSRVALTVQRSLALGLLSLPRFALRRLVGDEKVVDGNTLDLQAQLLMKLAPIAGKKPHEHGSVATARKVLDASARVLAPLTPPMARTLETFVRSGEHDVPLRVYVPRALATAKSAPALVYYHGGGFVLGSIDSHDGVCRALAHETPCIVVSVDYRLAPEHKFPAGVEDAIAAFRWVHENARSLNVDPDRLAVGGDSAGGNLAAVVSNVQKDAGGPHPAFQLLVYPATDLAREMPSHHTFAEGYLLDYATTGWFLDHYVRSSADIDDPRGSPLRAKDLRGVPRAMVITAGFDPLRDEGEAYARKLEAAGVSVMHRRDGGMFHGYFSTSGGLTVSKQALAAAVEALRTV